MHLFPFVGRKNKEFNNKIGTNSNSHVAIKIFTTNASYEFLRHQIDNKPFAQNNITNHFT